MNDIELLVVPIYTQSEWNGVVVNLPRFHPSSDVNSKADLGHF